jgi:hypothetical protein
MPRPRTALVLSLAGFVALAACNRQPAQSGAAAGLPSEPVVNSELHLTLDPPESAGFKLVANEGDRLELVKPASEGREDATLTFEVGPPQRAGVNLVEAVNQQKAAIEGRPNGKFMGQVQLGSQLGNAYSTRGRYTGDDGRESEEIRLFAVHPEGDRLLSLTYRYHADTSDSKERTQEAMAALGLVSPAAAEPAGAEPPASPPKAAS